MEEIFLHRKMYSTYIVKAVSSAQVDHSMQERASAGASLCDANTSFCSQAICTPLDNLDDLHRVLAVQQIRQSDFVLVDVGKASTYLLNETTSAAFEVLYYGVALWSTRVHSSHR